MRVRVQENEADKEGEATWDCFIRVAKTNYYRLFDQRFRPPQKLSNLCLRIFSRRLKGDWIHPWLCLPWPEVILMVLASSPNSHFRHPCPGSMASQQGSLRIESERPTVLAGGEHYQPVPVGSWPDPTQRWVAKSTWNNIITVFSIW